MGLDRRNFRSKGSEDFRCGGRSFGDGGEICIGLVGVGLKIRWN